MSRISDSIPHTVGRKRTMPVIIQHELFVRPRNPDTVTLAEQTRVQYPSPVIPTDRRQGTPPRSLSLLDKGPGPCRARLPHPPQREERRYLTTSQADDRPILE